MQVALQLLAAELRQEGRLRLGFDALRIDVAEYHAILGLQHFHIGNTVEARRECGGEFFWHVLHHSHSRTRARQTRDYVFQCLGATC